MAPIQIRVRTGSSQAHYPIVIGSDVSARLAELLDRFDGGRRRLLVSSPRVWSALGTRIRSGLPGVPHVLAPDGEQSKHLRTVVRLYDAMARAGVDRGTVIVVVGGGVLGDMAGLAAATWLRGLALVHVPTTVVAQVDSAIGGKVGVNHARGKNLIGAFHPPLAVLTDPSLLSTLPRREFQAGLYEVVKYGVIASPPLFRRVERGLAAIEAQELRMLVGVIAECSRIKARVVSADEHETGVRRILNFGHTIGHALEAVTEYRRFRHGEAVGWGMLAATEISRARAELPESDATRIAALVDRLGPRPPIDDLSAAACVAATRRDKKVIRGRLHFVLPTAIGATRITADVSEPELTRALRRLGMP
jgi:3-dehydroquinate synthase